jgi:hypothetical protein
MAGIARLAARGQQPVQLLPDLLVAQRVQAHQGVRGDVVDDAADHFFLGDGGHAGAGEAGADERRAERRRVGGDAQIARQCQRQPAAEGRPVHGREEDLRRGPDVLGEVGDERLLARPCRTVPVRATQIEKSLGPSYRIAWPGSQ